MKEQYHNNRIFISKEEQETIKDYPIIFIGNATEEIAECALKLGFENITLIDDNYKNIPNSDLKSFNHNTAHINHIAHIPEELCQQNEHAMLISERCPLSLKRLIGQHKVAINGLNINEETTPLFDSLCKEIGIPVMHPFNLGWGGLVTIVDSQSLQLSSIINHSEKYNTIQMAEYASGYLKYWGNKQFWLDDIIAANKNKAKNYLTPQLPIAQSILAGMCTHLLFNIATIKSYKTFPEFYLTSIM